MRGTVWLLVALLAMMYGFQTLAEPNGIWQLVAMAIVATLGLLAFLAGRTGRAVDPIIDLKLFENRTFACDS